MHTYVHSSTIHSSHEVGATHSSVDERINRVLYIYAYSGILFSLKKEGIPDTCYNMEEPRGHCVKWNKPVTKRQILYDSTYMRCVE